MKQNKKINEARFGDTDANGKKWEDYETIVCPDGQIIDMQKLLDEQERTKAALCHVISYFKGFVSKLRYVYTFHVETQATDGYNIFVNPQFTYNLDMTGKAFVMAHEIVHCLLNHMRRGKDHDRKRSNIAADYEVNSWLVEIGLVRPSDIEKIGALYDKKYTDWGYEKIYAANPSGPSDSMQPNPNQQQQAQKNQQQQNDKQNQSGGGGQKQQYSDQYKAGWNKAMEDYKAGKLKL